MQRAKSILLVEDDNHIAETMTMLLAAEGMTVRWADDLAEARILFNAEVPDLVLLDYCLKSERSKLTDFIREIKPTPVILITAISNAEAIAATLEINRLVKKPFAIDDLLGAISDTLSARAS